MTGDPVPNPDSYPGVPARLVGWCRFTLDLGAPVLGALLALAGALMTIVTGDAHFVAAIAAAVVGGAAGIASKSARTLDETGVNLNRGSATPVAPEEDGESSGGAGDEGEP
jgi:hypothetical protein